MFLLKVLLLISLFFATGRAFLNYFRGFRKISSANIGISIIMGAGLLAFFALVLNTAGLPFNLLTLLSFTAANLILSSLIGTLARKNRPGVHSARDLFSIDRNKLQWNLILRHSYVLLSIFVILIAAYYFRNSHLSWAYDSITQWQGRGIVWSHIGNISNSFSFGVSRHAPLYAIVLGIEHLAGIANPGMISAILLASLILVFGSTLSNKAFVYVSFLFLSTLLLLPQIVLRLFNGTSEIFVAVFAVGGLFLLQKGLKTENLGIWVLSGILWGVFTASRSDNLIYISFMCIPIYFYLLTKKKWSRIILHALPLSAIAVSVNLMYRIAGESIVIKSLWVKPLIVLPRIGRVFIASLRAQVSENYISLTTLLLIVLILGGFKFGKGKWPLLIGLFCLIGMSAVFGVIDSFWETDYLEKWMNTLNFFHENDGGISRYTLVANVFFYMGALMILKQGILSSRKSRLNRKTVIMAWPMLFLFLVFCVFKYGQEKHYRYASGTQINAFLGTRPILSVNNSRTAPKETPASYEFGTKIAPGTYNVKVFSRQTKGPNDSFVGWFLSDQNKKLYGLNYPVGFIYTTPNITQNSGPTVEFEQGPISITPANLKSGTEIQLYRVEMTNSSMNIWARFIPWISLMTIILALVYKIVQFHIPSFSLSRLFPALLIALALFPNIYLSRFVYSRELSLADYCRTHSYNESAGMQFGKYIENILDLVDRFTGKGDRIFFLGSEFTPAMTGPLILFQKYGSSRVVFHKDGITDQDLLKNPARTAALADFVIIGEPYKHPELETLLSKYPHAIAPVRGDLKIYGDEISLSENNGIDVLWEEGTKDLTMTDSAVLVSVETPKELAPFLTLRILPAIKFPHEESPLALSFEPHFETEYWTSPRFQYEIKAEDGRVLKEKSPIDLRSQKLEIPQSFFGAKKDHGILVTFYIERRKSGGTLLAEYLLDVRNAQPHED